MKNFDELSERELLALAISLEEEDERVYSDFAHRLRQNFPESAKIFDGMRAEESGHRRRLQEMYLQKFGEHIPLIRRQDVKGFVERRAVWLRPTLSAKAASTTASSMEAETRRFYEHAAARTTDASIRRLLDDLAQEERSHEDRADELTVKSAGKQEKDAQNRLFLLQVVQPGLAGLMDGSVSTLAPVFAAAFATRATHAAFLVGLAASLGAGISMGFAEALSDDGTLTGRGHPLLRGLVCGCMTAVGGIGHTLPFLTNRFRLAIGIAVAVVVAELGTITWVRHRFMETPAFSAAVQVAFGGAIVFGTGILIGSW
jgi:erythrin-vacuolar iron transport family protein